jgi:hypothetical protein
MATLLNIIGSKEYEEEKEIKFWWNIWSVDE